MFKINWKLLRRILFGKGPPLPKVVEDKEEKLHPEGLTMGTLYIGRQGTGKTSSLSGHLVDYFTRFRKRAIFVLDWSGSISHTILTFVRQFPRNIRDSLEKRIIYDQLGNPDWVIPLPEFSELYGFDYEQQVQRVSLNLSKLQPELVTGAPFIAGLAIREIAPQICRLITAIVNEHHESWQITEAKKLIADPILMRRAIKEYGHRVPEAKWFLEKVYLAMSNHEKELRSYSILALLGAIEPQPIRARLGYNQPGWTPKEAIAKGQLVLIDGSRLINQRNAQHYLFTQIYSMIMAEINKRQPGDPRDRPVALVMDEVYSLLSIPGMAEEVGMLAPLYRSRKLELYIVLQTLSQLAPNLRQQIWSIGNLICFAISNFDEAYEIAQQLFKYEPQTIKMQPKTDVGQPIIEPDRGQYLKIANHIQRFNHRECILRRYMNEKILDKYVRHIPKTKENPVFPFEDGVNELKERLLKARGVQVEDALEVINNRTLTIGKPPTV
jgi:hypothetical protein